LGEGFTSESGLIDRDVDSLSETAVGGDNITDFERDHVTGYEDGGFDFGPRSLTLALGFGCERVHEGLDGISSVAFLVETDGRVDEKQENDTDEILPVRGTVFAVGQGDGDEGSTFHDPGERIPHETEELKVGRSNVKRNFKKCAKIKSTYLEEGVLLLLL
jgi:hypothetical protein